MISVILIVTCYIMLSYREVVCDIVVCFFFQAEDGIRDLVRSRGLGDVYKRQGYVIDGQKTWITSAPVADFFTVFARAGAEKKLTICLLYTSDAADERSV